MTNKSTTFKWGECYYDHFERFLGKPLGRNRFEQDANSPLIQIIHYDNIFGGCRAFCSFGLSNYEDEIGEIAEVFMPIDDGWDLTANILANSLFYMVQKRMQIGWGMTIRFANIFPEFEKRYGKAALYFSTPFGVPAGFNQVSCKDKIGNIYLACYISETEREYFLNQGARNFEALLEKKNADVFHLTRPSVV